MREILRPESVVHSTMNLAVVTGGASGIGKCIAEEFRKQGVKHVRITDKWGETFVGLLLRRNHEIKLKNSKFR